MDFAQATLAIAGTYLLVGLVFGLAFVTLGVQRIDPAAHGTSIVFRLVILPGCMALWPMLAAKWLRRGRRKI